MRVECNGDIGRVIAGGPSVRVPLNRDKNVLVCQYYIPQNYYLFFRECHFIQNI